MIFKKTLKNPFFLLDLACENFTHFPGNRFFDPILKVVECFIMKRKIDNLLKEVKR